MNKIKVAFACDHAGLKMKNELVSYLESQNYIVKDFGTFSEESSDYADFIHPMSKSVESKEFNFGVAICGSGNGANMTANKRQGIRSALCWKKEIAELARSHNNANICAMPARFISLDDAKLILDGFLNTDFEGGRHERRINKIPVK